MNFESNYLVLLRTIRNVNNLVHKNYANPIFG